MSGYTCPSCKAKDVKDCASCNEMLKGGDISEYFYCASDSEGTWTEHFHLKCLPKIYKKKVKGKWKM